MWSWRLATILGIDVKVHLTFPLIFVWAAFQFGAGRSSAYGLYGMFLVLLLFVCVLLHEFGHALVAQRFNIPVEDITLLPIGGLAKFRTMNDRPLEEFLIAIAGPLVNVAIAIAILPLLYGLTDILNPERIASIGASTGMPSYVVALGLLGRSLQGISVAGAIAYLFVANLMLALFNMLPAFPMDGGRVLRALLASVFSYQRATWLAVRGGQLLALVGLLRFGLQAGIGLALIAVFVLFAGNAELQRVRLREILKQGEVGTYMMRALQPLYPAWNLYAARLLSQQSGQRVFPVVEGQTLLGLLTVREIAAHPATAVVGDAMVTDYSVLPSWHTLYDAQLALQNAGHFAAAVIDDGVLKGLLTLEDIERAYVTLLRPRQPQAA